MIITRRLCSTVAVFLSIGVVLSASAQVRRQGPDLTQSLTEKDRPIVQRLGNYASIDANAWRFHAGDVPHGESPQLDDHDWAAATPATPLGEDAVWLRQWIEIPKDIGGYDFSGAQVMFALHASSNSNVPQIIYLNGNRVALGEDLEPITLVASAHPGDRVLVAVKLLATSSPKHLRRTEIHVVPATGRPDPSILQAEILTAASLIPSLSKNPASDMAIVERAIGQIEEGEQNPANFDRSLESAETTLAVLRPLLRQVTYHLTGNSHIDAAWLWPVSETVDVVHRTFATALQLMDEYPQYTYTQSAAQYNEWLADKYPSINKEIAKRIREGRWEVVGGMWVEPDLNLPGGESIVRSILLGKRFFKQQYGVDVRIGWNPDTFGYNWQMPQIYKRSGIDYFVTQKMAWNDTNVLPLKLFWWQSPDGSKVLTYFPNNYSNNNLDPKRLTSEYLRVQKFAPGMKEMLDLYGVGDHGGGPTRAILDQGVRWTAPDMTVPKMQFGTASSYFEEIAPKIAPQSKTWDYKTLAQGYEFPAMPAEGQIGVPTWKDELYLEFHRGTYTTQANQKLGMRRSEIEMLDAEKFASLGWLTGSKYPADDFTSNWEKITFNDFHDLAAGSGIGVIYRDANKDFAYVQKTAAAIQERSLSDLNASVNTAGQGVPVVIWNSLAWKRSGLITTEVQLPESWKSVSVSDSAGHVVPSEVARTDVATHRIQLRMNVSDVPAMGYSVLHVLPTETQFNADVSLHGTTLENRFLRVAVDGTTGCITSIFDKVAQQEALAVGACGDQLQAFADHPKVYDAWEIQPGTLDETPAIVGEHPEVKPIPSALRPAIQVSSKWQSSKFTQTISLAADSRYVRIDSDIEWHEHHVLLKTAFKLRHTDSEASFEIPYGAIQRPTTRNNSWEKARFEVPAQYWADLGDTQYGVSLLNDSKYGYDALGDTLRLSLLRGPVSPDPDADQGMHHTAYAIYPHASTWQSAGTARVGYEFNYPLLGMQTLDHHGQRSTMHSYVEAVEPNIIVTAIKKAEDENGLVIRLYDSTGMGGPAHLRIPAGATQVSGELMTEQGADTDVQASLGHDQVTLHLKSFQIVTLLIRYPVSTTN